MISQLTRNALKGQQQLAQGSALGGDGSKPTPYRGKSINGEICGFKAN